MTPVEYLHLHYPVLRGAPGAPITVQDEEKALLAAKGHRPSCLNSENKNLAQAHYAAYILSMHLNNARRLALAPLTEEREGEVWIKYGKYAENGGPMTPHDAYSALARRCRSGGITVNPTRYITD